MFAAAESLVNAANKADELAKAMDLEESDEPFSLGKHKRNSESKPEALVNAANKADELAKAMDLEESDKPFSLGKRTRKSERSSLRKALRLSEFER